MKSKTLISASILNIDFSNLKDEVVRLEEAGVDSFHMDIMDGIFVNNISFGPDIVSAVRRNTSLPIHTHLMIMKPESFYERFFDAGSDSVTFHVERINADREKILLRDNTGLSLNPDISLDKIFHYSPFISKVLLMSVFAGFGGQRFINESIERISALKDYRERTAGSFNISVDGGIIPETASLAASAGADELIVGSYITASSDPFKSVREIKEAVHSINKD